MGLIARENGEDGNGTTAVAVRRVEPRFIEPAEADAAPMIGLHRNHDGYITFHKRDARGQFCDLFSVKATELGGSLFPELVQPHLDTDAYFSVNGFYRPGYSVSKAEPKLAAPLRRSNALRWLTACYVDLDCYKLGISVGQAIGAIIDMQDAGAIPAASMLTRSGRGVWAFWMLADRLNGRGPQRASSQAVLTYRRLQAKLGELTLQLGHDAQARDLARITRVPGTLHGTTGARVAYWFQADENGEPFTYTLAELCGRLNVAPGDLDPTLKKIIDPALSERGRTGHKALNAKRLKNIVELMQIRQGLRRGHRARGLWLYGGWLLKNGIDHDDMASRVRAVGRRGCLDANGAELDPLPEEEIDTQIREAKTLRKVQNQTIADWLDITPEESVQLDGWPCAARFQTGPKVSYEPRTRTEKRTVRRAMILAILNQTGGVVPTLEELQAKLDELFSIEASKQTISTDLAALGITNPRRKAKSEPKAEGPTLYQAES